MFRQWHLTIPEREEKERGIRGALDSQNIQTICLMRILSCSQRGDQSSPVSRLGTTTMNNQTYIECDNKPCRQFTNRQYISPCSPTASSLLRGGTGYVAMPLLCQFYRIEIEVKKSVVHDRRHTRSSTLRCLSNSCLAKSLVSSRVFGSLILRVPRMISR